MLRCIAGPSTDNEARTNAEHQALLLHHVPQLCLEALEGKEAGHHERRPQCEGRRKLRWCLQRARRALERQCASEFAADVTIRFQHTVHTRMMTGRKTVIATNRKKMPAPMNAAKYVNCAADGMLQSEQPRSHRHGQKQHENSRTGEGAISVQILVPADAQGCGRVCSAADGGACSAHAGARGAERAGEGVAECGACTTAHAAQWMLEAHAARRHMSGCKGETPAVV
jgi:hypothetical protein